jgi:hypothetical protein
LQGVGWVTRKIIKSATITLHIKHYKSDQGVEHIDIEQTLTGGLTASPETRTLDWTLRKVDNSLFGAAIAKSRRIPVAEITDEYLRQGWLPDVSRDGAIEAYAESDKEKNSLTWKSNMVSGFAHLRVVDTAWVDVMMQHRYGVSKISRDNVSTPEGSGSQVRKVKTSRLVSSTIMVCRRHFGLSRFSL